MAEKSDHDGVVDLLGAFAADSLEPSERAAVERHLPTCPSCRGELRQHWEALAALTPDERPPPDVWERIAGRLGEPE